MGRLIVAMLLLFAASASQAADLKKVERRIAKEPAYQSKSPGYVLLAIGPEAKDRVWLVRDGDVLYVDRNGDGDLTASEEKITTKKSSDDGRAFEVGTLTLGGKTHNHLKVSFAPLKQYMFREWATRPDMLAALKDDPDAEVLTIMGDFEAPHLKPKGRVTVLVGPIDADGPLLPAKRPTDARIVHIAGPIQVTFYGSRPTLRRNTSTEFMLAAGTPGLGGGTFAMLCYDETIPKSVLPIADVSFPPAKQGGESVKKRFELKERC